MAETISIRLATTSEQAALAEMMLCLNKFEHSISANRNIRPDAGMKHLEYCQNLIKTEGGFVIIADDNGTPAGFLIGTIIETEGHYIDPDLRKYGSIHDLFVHAQYRGRGLGKALLQEAELRFKALAITRMDLYALRDNTNAVNLYEGQGFSVREVHMEKEIK